MSMCGNTLFVSGGDRPAAKRGEDMEPVTNRQRQVIWYIEDNLGIRFTGTTKQEARQWISQHMEASKKAANRVTIPESAFQPIWPYSDVKCIPFTIR